MEEGIPNAAFLQADAQIHPFEGPFDRVISRTGAMFFGAPVDAFGNLARATRSGGGLTLLVWQDLLRNEWVREFFTALAAGRELPQPPPDAPGPFSMADPERTRDVLTRAGWSTPDVTPLESTMYFGASADDAYDFILGLLAWMLEGLDGDGRRRAQEALHATCERHETAEGVLYDAAAWLITAVRR
jgi:SAM-dependent methyltransferase